MLEEIGFAAQLPVTSAAQSLMCQVVCGLRSSKHWLILSFILRSYSATNTMDSLLKQLITTLPSCISSTLGSVLVYSCFDHTIFPTGFSDSALSFLILSACSLPDTAFENHASFHWRAHCSSLIKVSPCIIVYPHVKEPKSALHWSSAIPAYLTIFICVALPSPQVTNNIQISRSSWSLTSPLKTIL